MLNAVGMAEEQWEVAFLDLDRKPNVFNRFSISATDIGASPPATASMPVIAALVSRRACAMTVGVWISASGM